MNDFFASIYESDFFYDQAFSMALFQAGTYMKLFLSMILPSTLLMAVFYFLIKYPFCRWFHWLGVLLLGSIVTGLVSHNLLSYNLAEFLMDEAGFPGISTYISNLIFYNVFLSLIVGFLTTLLFKRAPLPQRNVPW